MLIAIAASSRRASRSVASGRRARLRLRALRRGGERSPSGTLATPREPILKPGTKRGFAAVVALVHDVEAERVVVGLPLSLSGGDSAQTLETREFAAKLHALV